MMIALCIVVAVAILFRIGAGYWRHHQLGDFARIRSRENQARLDALVVAVETDRQVVGGYIRGAKEHWQVSRVEAVRRLDLACAHLEEFGPDFRKALKVMRNMARSVSITASPRALRVAAYKLWQTRGLAGVASLLHWVVVTGRERVLVRVWFLRRAFGVVARVLVRRAWLARSTVEWDGTIEDAVGDLMTVEQGAVQTYEVILAALDQWEAARRRHAPAV
jgi:hypothetical protein